jgi:hypothetical protein
MQPQPLRRVQSHGPQRLERRQTGRDRGPPHLVQVAAGHHRVSRHVVGDQREGRPERQGEKGRHQLRRDCLFLELQVHPEARLFERHGERVLGVVGIDPRGEVPRQLRSRQPRAMAIDDDPPAGGGPEDPRHSCIAPHHGAVVHHLPQGHDAGFIEQSCNVGRVEFRPGRLETGQGGHAGRNRHQHRQGSAPPCAGKPAQPCRPRHVDDLVRICQDGGGPVRKRQLGKRCGDQKGALDVHVGVHEPGGHQLPASVDPLVRRAGGPWRQDATDQLPRDGHVGREQFTGQNRDHPSPGDQQVIHGGSSSVQSGHSPALRCPAAAQGWGPGRPTRRVLFRPAAMAGGAGMDPGAWGRAGAADVSGRSRQAP